MSNVFVGYFSQYHRSNLTYLIACYSSLTCLSNKPDCVCRFEERLGMYGPVEGHHIIVKGMF